MGVGIWNASFPLLFKASLKEIMHTLRAHILSDCCTGPPYIHKGTRRRVKKGNTKPRPFWLNVYFIVIKMPACIIIVCVHWNIYLRMVERAGNNSNKTQELHTLLLLYIVPPVTLLEGTEQSNQNFYTCDNFQAGSTFLSILIWSDFKFVISKKKFKDSLYAWTSYLCSHMS